MTIGRVGTTIGVSELVVTGLAAWRLSSMLVDEVGPGGVFEKLREWSGVVDGPIITTKNDWTPLWCLLCTSMWIGFGLEATRPAAGLLRAALAVSAVAVIVERGVRRWL